LFFPRGRLGRGGGTEDGILALTEGAGSPDRWPATKLTPEVVGGEVRSYSPTGGDCASGNRPSPRSLCGTRSRAVRTSRRRKRGHQPGFRQLELANVDGAVAGCSEGISAPRAVFPERRGGSCGGRVTDAPRDASERGRVSVPMPTRRRYDRAAAGGDPHSRGLRRGGVLMRTESSACVGSWRASTSDGR